MPISEVYNCDCLEYMKTIPDKFFDLCIADPPYGIGISGQRECICKNPKFNRKLHVDKGWDTNIPESGIFEQIFRISKKAIIWGANYFVKHLTEGHKGWIVWYKGQQGLTMSDCELAYSNFDTPTRVIIINRAVLNKEGTIHPTQKPISLYSWLLDNYAIGGVKYLTRFLGVEAVG